MNSNYEWMATNLLRQAGTAIVRAGGHNPQIPTDCSQFFPRLLKPKRGNPGVGGPQKQTKGIYSTINVQYIYIYILYIILYIYICIHWYTMIYRYTEKIKKAQDDWRISRLKPFLDQRADGGLREIRQLNPPMSNRIKWDSLGNTLIHLKFILSIILKYIHIYIYTYMLTYFKHVEEKRRFSSWCILRSSWCIDCIDISILRWGPHRCSPHGPSLSWCVSPDPQTGLGGQE